MIQDAHRAEYSLKASAAGHGVLPGSRGSSRFRGWTEDGPVIPHGGNAMTSCDLDTPVCAWIIDDPESPVLYQQLEINDSCGGKSLAQVCRKSALEAAIVLKELHRCQNDAAQA